jgi:uncharacterized protein
VIKRRLKKILPSHEMFRESRWLRWLDPWLGHPRLWHMHRRSVAKGVAIGLVTGLIPGPIQILLAALLAIPLRANIPAAAFATLYTNPLTFVPLYLLAYQVGRWVTGSTAPPPVIPAEVELRWGNLTSFVPEMFRWVLSLGDTLLIGLAIQSSVFALAGYVLTMLLWRTAVGWAWARRRHVRVAK